LFSIESEPGFILLGRDRLTIDEVAKAAHFGFQVAFTVEPAVWWRLEPPHRHIQEALRSGRMVYGVTTNSGGIAKT